MGAGLIVTSCQNCASQRTDDDVGHMVVGVEEFCVGVRFVAKPEKPES